jgi:hypothetical protein
MPEALTYLGALKTLIGKLPAWVVRYWYPAGRLADLLYVDIFPRSDSVWINFGSSPEIRVQIQVINLSPFPCEIEQGQLELLCEGVSVKLRLLQRRRLASGEIAVVCLHEALSDGQAKTIRANWGSNTTSMSGTVEVASSINRFTKPVQNLSGIHVSPANR